MTLALCGLVVCMDGVVVLEVGSGFGWDDVGVIPSSWW